MKTTGVKLQFLPPPMEGTISLGIYDRTGKLVRTLHRAATGDEFTVAVDGYITRWDGLDDAGKQMPPGHYAARGYMVGNVTVQAAPASESATGTLTFSDHADKQPGRVNKVRVSLVANPLERDRAGSADLCTEIDSTGAAWLALSDGLPLKQVSAAGDFDTALIGRASAGQPLIVFLLKAGAKTQEFEITKTANMMAFDCGGFDLPGK